MFSIHTGDDLSNVTARLLAETAIETVKLSKEIAEGAVKSTGKVITQGTYLVLKALLVKMTEYNKNLNPGKTNLGKLLKSDKELKMVDIKAEDLKYFAARARKFGICYAVVKDGDKNHVIFKTEDTERMEKVFKSTINAKLDGQKKEHLGNKRKSIIHKAMRKLNPKDKVPESIWNEIENKKKEIKNKDSKSDVKINKKANINYSHTRLRKGDLSVINTFDKDTKAKVNYVLKSVNEMTRPNIRNKLDEFSRISHNRNITRRRTRRKTSRGRRR